MIPREPARDGRGRPQALEGEGEPIAISWSAIQDTFDPAIGEHARRAESLGLECPLDVFEQLFHERHDDAELASTLRWADWSHVEWTYCDLSGAALRHVAVPRYARLAVDEARRQTLVNGFSDERPDVMQHWQAARTWVRSPVIVAGEVLQSELQYEILVGFTRLGNVLGALDRQDVPQAQRHRVWLAQPK